MGLDMWLYKVKTTEPATVKKHLWENNAFALENYILFTAPSQWLIEKHPECYRDIFPYMIDGKLRKSKVSETMVRKKYGLPAGCYTYEVEEKGNHRILAKVPDGTVYEIFPTDEEYEKVCNTVISDVCTVEKVLELYWSKKYDIQRDFYYAYPGVIENCGYHCIDEEEVNDILKRHMPKEEYVELLPQLTCSDDECFLYYEWY